MEGQFSYRIRPLPSDLIKHCKVNRYEHTIGEFVALYFSQKS